MLSFEDALKIVTEFVDKQQFVVPPKGLYEPIEYVLSIGGKRIRPSLAYMAFSLYDDDYAKLHHSAMALEVFHNFTLLHDDVMDNASVRRNCPTVHQKWDVNTAILSGDAMLIRAYQYVAKTPSDKLHQMLTLFSQTGLEVCEGQQYDMEFETRNDVSIDEYLEMIRLKTAVLLACSLKTGAIVAGAPTVDADHLYSFGLNLGLAFQLKDDWLDVFGHQEAFGKAIGNDIVSNKKTFLLLSALESAKGDLKDELILALNDNSIAKEEKIRRVKDVYLKLHVKELSEVKMSYYYDLAKLSLASVNIDSAKKTELEQLASLLMDRDR